MSKLAKEMWMKHKEIVLDSDLYRTKEEWMPLKEFNEKLGNAIKLALFNALETLEAMRGITKDVKTFFSPLSGGVMHEAVEEAIDYLKGSKYYSDENKDADY